MSNPVRPPEECANCGGEIPPNARACPHCGADERTGWRESSIYDGLDLPEESWSEDDHAPAGTRLHRKGALPWYWVAAFIFVLAILILGALGLRP